MNEPLPIHSPGQPGWTELFPDEDYRFHFGLKPGSAAEFFGPTRDHAKLLSERRKWLQLEPESCVAMLPAALPLLEESIALAQEWKTIENSIPASNQPLDRCIALGGVWEPDFLLLNLDGDGRIRLLGGCVCFPSSWKLTDKVGRPLEEIHEPVPTLNPTIGGSIANFLSRLRPGSTWLRANWGLARTSELNLHPDRQMPRLIPPLEARDVWVRIENQALVSLPASRGILFGIRLEIISLEQFRTEPNARQGLHRALRTMPERIAEYKGLAVARNELLKLLDSMN